MGKKRKGSDEARARREKILDRVRALLAMTIENGCTEAEALAAAEKVSLLMEEYDITFADVESLRKEEVDQKSKSYADKTDPRSVHLGAFWVMVPIANYFDCKTWYNGTNVVFFGVRSDAELAQEMLGLVCLAMDTELLGWLNTATGSEAAGNREALSSFMRGMGDRIGQRLRIIKEARTEKGRSRGTDLVALKGQLVDEKFADYLRRTGQSDFTKNTGKAAPLNEAAFLAGWAAADRVDLGDLKVGSEAGKTKERPPDWLSERIYALRDQAFKFLQAGDDGKAHSAFVEALSIARGLTAAAPDDQDTREVLRLAVGDHAYGCHRAGANAEAIASYREAVELARRLVADRPDEAWYRNRLISHLNGLGRSLTALNDHKAARATHREAEKEARTLLRKTPADADAQAALRDTLGCLADADEAARRLWVARRRNRERHELAKKIVTAKADDEVARVNERVARENLERIDAALTRRSAALALISATAVGGMVALLAHFGKLPDWLPDRLKGPTVFAVLAAVLFVLAGSL